MKAEPLRPPARRGSIAARLAWLYIGVTAILLLVAETFLYWGLTRSLRHQDERLLASKTRVLRLLLLEPAKLAALESEIEHEAGEDQALKYYLRILGPDRRTLLETPEMADTVPTRVFPAVAPTPEGTPVIAAYRASPEREFLLLAAPARGGADGREPRTLHIALDTSLNRELLRDSRRRLLLVFAGGTLFAALAGVFVTRAGLRPLRDITRTTQRISARHLDDRLDAAAWPAELSELAAEFDAMLDRLQEAFNRLSEFSADLAHALRNPINNLRGEAEVALTRARSPEEYRQTLGSALEEFERLSRLIDGLLFIARADNPRTALESIAFSARAEMDAVRDFYEALAAERNVSVVCLGDATILGDPTLVRRAISNLLGNALKNTPAGGSITLTTRRGENGAIEVSVADTGCGIAPEHVDRVFERFFQVDKTRHPNANGAGLGLAIVRSIMQLHGGTATLESAPDRGTTVTLHFPPPPIPPKS